MGNPPISSIVDVTISRETSSVTQAGFGTPLILTDEDSGWGGELVRSYSSVAEVLEDFTSSDDAYKAAVAVFAQSPKVETVKIGAEGTRTAQVSTIVFSGNIITGNTVSAFTITSGGKTETITATDFDTNMATTLTAIAAKIQATNAITTSVSNGTTTITNTAAKAGVPFSTSAITITGGASQATVTLATPIANVGPGDFLADISEEDDDWYGLIWANERDEDLVYAAAVYVETTRKIFITASQDADLYDAADTDDIAYLLSAANYSRTAVIYNADVSDMPDAAWMGKLFPFDPGSETWKFKTLAGITADNLTTSRRNAVLDKNANLYVTIGGTDMTEEGTMASGEFIDIIRGVDWLQARLEERIFSRLVNLPKVPFTDGGIAIIEAEIRAVLENAIKAGLVSPDVAYTVTVPLASEVSSNDKANRLLPDIAFTAVLAGAIHHVTINGVVTV